VVLSVVVGACGGSGTESGETAAVPPVEGNLAGPGGGVTAGTVPTGIPADIPLLDGEITYVLADSRRVRLFCSG